MKKRPKFCSLPVIFSGCPLFLFFGKFILPYFDFIVCCHNSTSSPSSVDFQAPYSSNRALFFPFYQVFGIVNENLLARVNILLSIFLFKSEVNSLKHNMMTKIKDHEMLALVFFLRKFVTFQENLTDARSATILDPSYLLYTINQSFQMRYCMTLYLKGHQKYYRSKLKLQLLLSKFRLFNFDLSYF